MELDVFTLEDAREAWRSDAREEVLLADIEGLTLGAALEAACWHATGDSSAQNLLKAWSLRSSPLEQAIFGLAGAPLARPDDFSSPSLELRQCPNAEELGDTSVGVEWHYFLERFRRSLGDRLAFEMNRAWQISAAFHEMADNVVQHANLGIRPAAVVGYLVAGNAFEFAVADIGRGILASLRENPRYADLESDADALRAACTGGASRRTVGAGTGFADLLRAVADLEGWLSFRSGTARLVIDGRGVTERREVLSNSVSLRGFQLSVRGLARVSRWGT